MGKLVTTDDEQAASTERKRKIADPGIDRQETEVSTDDATVTWIRHVRPQRAEVAAEDAP